MDALVALVVLSVLGQTHSYVCPRSNARGLQPDPEDCSKYYQCVDGGRYYHKSCPPGLWFDSRYSICNWPGYVSCYSRRPEIQPLASEESDPVLSGTIRRYPQQLGRQVYTTRKRSTFRTLPTSRPIRRRTTLPARVYRTSKTTTLWTSRIPDIKTRTARSPQTEKPTTRQQPTTTENPSPGPVATPQSVLDWLYEDNLTDEMEEPQADNAHPQAPPKPTPQTNPINNVASMDEYGGFDDTEDYQNTGFDTGFDPPPECSAAFSLELDPTRCEGFYQCYLWIPYPKVCPAGLLFDHQSNVCNWPEYVYCLNGERYDPPETTTTEKVVTRAPPTPPIPSNNFNPQDNGGFLEENNYDDYWPIEEVMEGKRHQTAFKKKGLQAVSSQMVEEDIQKKSTPRVKATTLMMNTDVILGVHDGCGTDGCIAKNVETSDYKSQPKPIPSEAKGTVEKETTKKATGTDKVNDKKSHMKVNPRTSSEETSSSEELSSQSNSASNETESNESSMNSSSEFNGVMKADSSEEHTMTKSHMKVNPRTSSEETSSSEELSSQSDSASNETESNESSMDSSTEFNGVIKADSSEEQTRTKPTDSKSSSQESSDSQGSRSQSNSASNETESNESGMDSEFNGVMKTDSSEEQSKTKLKDSKSSSQESSDSQGSRSQSNSSSNETDSSESNSSSEGLEEVQSPNENNEIIKPKLTSNNLKIKENEIQVDIVQITDRDKNKLQQQDSTVRNESSGSETVKPDTDDRVSPVIEKETRAENSNATRIRDVDKTSNETSLREETNSADDIEGSGSEGILTKIDILRNAVDKFTSDDKQITTPLTTEPTDNFTDANVFTNETEVGLVSNITDEGENTTSLQKTSMPMSTDNTPSKTPTQSPTKITKPLVEKGDQVVEAQAPANETEGNITLNEEKLDSNLTKANVTGAAEGKSEKNSDISKLNATEMDSIASYNQTENSTIESDLPGEDLASNETIGNETSTRSNETTDEPMVKEGFNTTANRTQEETAAINTTESQGSANSTPSSTSALPTSKCREDNCQGQTDFSTTHKTKSGAEISRASSKTVEKAKAKRPDIVMLSGKSPIARILEKLLNIRMKQIGNNKFKAVESTNEAIKDTEVLSENKIKPKSQNDEGRTTSPLKASSSSELIKTTAAESINASKSSAEVSFGLTTVVSTTDINNFTHNGTSTDLPEDTETVNITMSLQNTTDNVGQHDASNQTNDTTIANNLNVESSTSTTIPSTELATVSMTNSTNDTSTFVENSTIQTTHSKDVLATAAAGRNRDKGSSVEDLNTTAKEVEMSTETKLPIAQNNVNESDAMSALPGNVTTTHSSSNVTKSNDKTVTLNETNYPLNSTELSNTNLSVHSTEENNSSTTTMTLYVKTTVNVSSDDDTPERNISSTETDSSLKNSSSTGYNTSTNMSTSATLVNATEFSETNGTTTTQTTPRTSRKQREVRRPARKPTHFRQVGNSPHFEARKVFGGPDEKWRFSDATLVDQFSRHQRDVDTLNASSFAASKIPQLLVTLMTVISILTNQLA